MSNDTFSALIYSILSNFPLALKSALTVRALVGADSWMESGVQGLQSVVLYSLPELDGAIETMVLGKSAVLEMNSQLIVNNIMKRTPWGHPRRFKHRLQTNWMIPTHPWHFRKNLCFFVSDTSDVMYAVIFVIIVLTLFLSIMIFL